MEYIAIKNWEKYQTDKSGKTRDGSSVWIKDYCDKESDYEYSQLTMGQRYLYDGLRRLRGRLGANPQFDVSWLCRKLDIGSSERCQVGKMISRLTSLSLISIVESATSLSISSRSNRKEVVEASSSPSQSKAKASCGAFSWENWAEGIDDLTAEQVCSTLKFWASHKDDFWRNTVKSEKSLRKNIAQMFEAAKSKGMVPAKKPVVLPVADPDCKECYGSGFVTFWIPGSVGQKQRDCECLKMP
jgi:hypothetical protein